MFFGDFLVKFLEVSRYVFFKVYNCYETLEFDVSKKDGLKSDKTVSDKAFCFSRIVGLCVTKCGLCCRLENH